MKSMILMMLLVLPLEAAPAHLSDLSALELRPQLPNLSKQQPRRVLQAAQFGSAKIAADRQKDLQRLADQARAQAQGQYDQQLQQQQQATQTQKIQELEALIAQQALPQTQPPPQAADSPPAFAAPAEPPAPASPAAPAVVMPPPSVVAPPATTMAPAAPVTPPPVVGYTLWLDASDESTLSPSSGHVTTWSDKSTSANHAMQTADTGKPLIVAAAYNGKTVLRFNGLTDFLSLNLSLLPLGTTARTIFVVSKTSNSNEAQVLSYGSITGPGQRVNLIVSPTILKIAGGLGNSGSISLASNLNLKMDSWSLAPSTTITNAQLRRNGAVVPNTLQAGSSVSINTGTLMPAFAYIGANDSRSQFFNGDIGEIIIYPQLLAESEMEQVNSYLLAKWAIQ